MNQPLSSSDQPMLAARLLPDTIPSVAVKKQEPNQDRLKALTSERDLINKAAGMRREVSALQERAQGLKNETERIEYLLGGRATSALAEQDNSLPLMLE